MEKQQSRARRKLLGRVDPVSGEIVPTRGYTKIKNAVPENVAKPGPVPISKVQRSFFCATYLLNQIGKATGVEADLKACFPYSYKQLLSIAYYLIHEGNNSMSRFSHWNRLHIHPCGTDVPSQRSSELFQNIDEASRMNFFKKQGMRRIEKEYWEFDTTSISSFSETLKQVKDVRNKENDRLP